jgi:pectin methylesterase-like acyl-CoA thioesterase/regulation of enolase protein 1 (concanavalin A-like superfamily)
MRKNWIYQDLTWAILLSLMFLAGAARAVTPWSLTVNTNNVIVVTNATYAAIGDGVFTNTIAFQNAINAAAAGGNVGGLRGGMVVIPPGIFLCGPLTMKSNVRLQLDSGAVIRLLPRGAWPGSPYTGTVSPLIDGSSLTNIAVTGTGMFDGQGDPWWPDYKTINRPLILSLQPCSKVLLQDFTSSNPPVAHIALKGAGGNINIIGVKLLAPSSDDPVNPSHNTDGVDLAETNAFFQDCFISTGDDNIAIGSSGSVSRDILVTNCFFGEGHGLSIGSYTSGGVSDLTVVDCTFSNTGNGIKVKSGRDRGGVVQNLNYFNIRMTNVDWPIQIYPYYEFGLGTLTGVTPDFAASTAFNNTNPVPYNPPIFRDITISNVTANILDGRPPLMIWGLPDYPAANIVLKRVNLNSSSTKVSGIYNVTNLQFVDCSFSVPAGVKTLQLWNADITFTNSLLATNLLLLDGLTTNGIGSTLDFYNAPATASKTNAIAGGTLTLANSTFTVSNSLTLSSAAPLNFVVGTNPATLAVKGNLTLGGIVNVTAGPGFTNGTYPLITYTGSLGGSGPTLGSSPGGYSCAFTTAAGVVNLVVSGGSLPAPTNLFATPTNGSVSLNWPVVPSATSYNLKRATVNGGPYSILANLSATNYTDAAVVSGTTYYYVVTALNATGESTNSPQASATPTGSVVWSPPWQTQDIGAVGLAGIASFTNQVFTVTGSGTDIYGTSDAFRFVYLSISGDCTITARVVTQQNIDQWSKAGVMVRASLAADAANALVGMTPNTANGATWQYRSTTGGSTSFNKTNGLSAPYWVRMVRSGNTFTGYRSADGIIWTQQGTTTITMASTVYIGLAVTSHNNSSLCTATFDNVTVPSQWPVQVAPSVAGVTNKTVIAGNNTTLNATVSGYPVPTLQWRSNSVALASQTNAALVLNNVQYAQNGTVYSLVANNAVGVVTNSMTLTVIVTPSITGLNNQAATVGDNVSIPATVSGVPSPVLRWRLNGTNLSDGATSNGSSISGSTIDTLAINNAQTADTGIYSLVASNAAGIVTNAMTLTVSVGNVAPFMTGPTDQTAVQTSNATFTASVSGLPVPTLQWRVNGANISDATNSSVTISNVQYSQNGFAYSLVASNTAGAITNSANLYVLVPPTISAQPTNLVVTNTQSATFTVTASGVPAPVYQWYFNNSAISGATASNYVFAAAPAKMGNYFVIVSNNVSSVTSSVATLTVNSTVALVSLTPTNGASGVCYDTPLYLTFSSQPVLRTPGTGKIRIFNVNNSITPVDTLDMGLNVTISTPYAVNTQPRTNGPNVFTEFPVIITGSTAAIYPHTGVLTSNQTYYVLVENGVFTDTSGAYFVGITATNIWKFTTKVGGAANPTNLVVAQDYSGDFATVQGAIDSIASGSTTPTIINLRDGTYTEVVLTYNRHKITFRGQSRSGARICYQNNNILNPGSSLLSVFKVNTANDIAVENLTITNLTPQGVAQAFALMVDAGSSRFICNNAEVSGFQDTIFINQASQTAYFNNSVIQGDVDYIWGSGVGFFTNCQINTLRATGGYVTQPRTPVGGNGFSFVNCSFTVPNSSYHNSLFARAIGVANGNTALVNCRVDTSGYTGWNATDVANASLNLRWWEYGNSNLNATASAVFNGTQLASDDPNLTNARSATLWLGGWTPTLAPNIISQPTNQSVSGGQPVSFAVSATGVPDPTYQWRKNGTNISSATNATFSIAIVRLADNATYSIVVSNTAGSVTSSNAALTVPAAPTPITPAFTNGALNLSWPADQIGFRLEAQTNGLMTGLGTNWFTVSGSSASNQFTVPINTTAGSIFFRLAYP